jgi:hypothetical protein
MRGLSLASFKRDPITRHARRVPDYDARLRFSAKAGREPEIELAVI